MNFQEFADKNKIYEVVSGSHAYGLNTPESDVDTRGLFIAPFRYTISPFVKVEEVADDTQDTKIYELRRFFELLEKMNPNIVELLWIPQEHVLFKHPIMDVLIAHKHKLLSSKVKHTYSGYAMAQMKRLRGHQKWITNPQPQNPPALWDYVRYIPVNGIEPTDDVAGQQLIKNAITSFTATKVNEHTFKLYHDSKTRYPIGFLTKADQTNPCFVDVALQKIKEDGLEFLGTVIVNFEAYQEKLKKWKQYWEWKNNRNAKRAGPEEKIGYDAKHASHTIRLLFAVQTILKDGIVPVRLPEEQRALVMEVKQGLWEYDKLMALADSLDKGLDDLYQKTSLPRTIDKSLMEALYVEMLENFFGIKIPL